MSAAPPLPPSEQPLVLDAQWRTLLETWNATRFDHPVLCVHQAFERQAAETPDAIAVAGEGRQLTFGELDRCANRLAHELVGEGVAPDTLVGICIDRCPELVVGLLAVLKAGGAYVPLDPGYPAERLAYMGDDADLRLVLTGPQATPFPKRVRTIALDQASAPAGGVADRAPETAVTPGHLAYVMYTSGSTGLPKGVMVTHDGLNNHIGWVRRAFPLGPDDRVVQKTPFSFDSSLIEFWTPLLSGARLVMARPGGHRDPAYLVRMLADERITFMLLVPSLLAALLDLAEFDACRDLRTVICAGEALSGELRDRFFRRSRALLSNHYGPTEGSIGSTFWNCVPGETEASVPIGRPVDNVQAYVFDPDRHPVGVGVAGELYVGGRGVARGYLNRPELTAERFVPNPFAPGTRLYRTGDLARFRPDGALEFLGRADDQVKVRGFRVELGEIETALVQHPGVRQAVVVTRDNGRGSSRLVACVVPAAGSRVTGAELRASLSRRLPEHMVPGAITLVHDIPVLPNGKVDRAALAALGRRRPQLDQPLAAPRDSIEGFLAQTWQEVLDVDAVGIHDRFFELGGDSIQAAAVLARLQGELGEPVFIATLFEAPTIADYGALLRREYPAAVARRFGAVPAGRPRVAERRVDAAMIAEARTLVPRGLSAPKRTDTVAPNPPALFILAPPRSGTTLLRVMLAGHPDLFAADELQLLSFESLAERAMALSGRFSLWREGAVRCLMEVKRLPPAEAHAAMDDLARRGTTTKQFYRELQALVQPRMLVDKSPSYAMDPDALRKAERDFHQPRYVHLVRHPYAMVRSFVERRMEQAMWVRPHAFSPRELGELIWVISHQNVAAFLSGVPEERWCRVRYEDLVERPRATMERLCEHMSLPFHDDLLQPYKDLGRKMVDGVHAGSTPMGDPKFREYGGISTAPADSWRGVAGDDFLGDVTWDVARGLGYDRPVAGAMSERGAARTRGVAAGREQRERARRAVRAAERDDG